MSVNALHDNIAIISRQGNPGQVPTTLPRTTGIDIKYNYATSELAKLCRTMENMVQDTQQCGYVMHFVSAYEDEGSAHIAFEAATVAATLTGKRVLFVDTAGRHQGAPKVLADALRVPLDALPPGRSMNEALVNISGTSFFYTALRANSSDGLVITNFDALRRLMDDLRLSYDLIVMHSDALMSSVFSTGLIKIVDGSVLVVEAERTRAPVALQAKQVIQENGGHLIGAVLNKRRLHIPNWIYRKLFR
jgi:Mrp family chromosome partitioning ATPase